MSSPLGAETLDKETGKRAVQIALEIKDKQLVLSQVNSDNQSGTESQTQRQKLESLRSKLTNQIWSSDKNAIETIVNSYVSLARLGGTETDIKVGELFEVFLWHYNDEFSDATFKNVRNALEPYFSSQDWFVRHQAYNLASLSYPIEANLNVALETAQHGLKQIPEGSDSYIFEAKVFSTSGLAYLHTMLLNLEHSVDSYSQQIDLKLSRGKPINGMSIINNLIYVFGAWKDNETAKDLIDILLFLEKSHTTSVKGLTEIRASRIDSRLGNFQTALSYAETAIDICETDTICRFGKVAKIVALAGLGRTDQARQALDMLQAEFGTDDWRSLTTTTNAYQIEALLAASEGDSKAAIQFMHDMMDSSVRQILSQNNGQTATLLASLQNNKERRDERAAALETEAELRRVALARQKFITRLLIVLSVILLGLVIAATAFARYRSKIAKDMEIAAKKALAGEKSKAEFLAIMSHELRTPLNGILGIADIMARKATDPNVQKKMNVIAGCGQDLVDLVENIFDMTLIESGDIHLYPERTNILKILSNLTEKWGPLIEDKGITFTAHIGSDVPEYMEVDKDRLAKSIDALLSNAHKFTNEGRVHLHVSAASQDGTDLTELKIIVADTGVGITDDAQARLFKPFVQADSSMTRHFGGAGLGLAIARGLTHMMSGDIIVNSRSERGSEFTLTIKAPQLAPPALKEAVTTQAPVSMVQKKAKTTLPNLSLKGTRILAAEDDLGSQAVLKDLLEPLGAKIIFTINGAEGLKALSLNQYDLIITDIRMPTMDGFTFVERIRQSANPHRETPILALTADVSAETSARCKAAGVDIFLMKPVKPKALYDAISHVQKKQRQSLRQISAVAS